MTVLGPHTVAAQEVAGRSLWQDALARLARNRAAVVRLAVLTVIALMALLAPWISPNPFDEVFWDEALQTYVLALDGEKAPCRVRASNAGHALMAAKRYALSPAARDGRAWGPFCAAEAWGPLRAARGEHPER